MLQVHHFLSSNAPSPHTGMYAPPAAGVSNPNALPLMAEKTGVMPRRFLSLTSAPPFSSAFIYATSPLSAAS